MGDPAQLPPVGESMSKTFTCANDMSELTQVMRQRSDNPILGVCTDIRRGIVSIKSEKSVCGTRGVRLLDKPRFYKMFESAFSHEAFNDDPDRTRVVAWRNSTVNIVNDMIHKIRYPECKEWLAVDELITFVNPLLNVSLINAQLGYTDDYIWVNTDFEARIIGCQKARHYYYDALDCWHVAVIDESHRRFEFYALDNESMKKRDIMLENIKRIILTP